MSAPFLRHPDRVLDAARYDLQAAGNPAYTVAVVDAEGRAELSPMIFARREPAAVHARQLSGSVAGEVVVVCREEVARRAQFTVYDASASHKLYSRTEMVEVTLADDDAPVGIV